MFVTRRGSRTNQGPIGGGKRKQSNRSKRRDGFRRNLSAAGSPRLRNQTRCNHPFYRPAEIRMCPDRAGAAPRGTIFVKDDRDRSDGRRAPVDLRPASVESGRVHHVRTSRDPPSRGRTDWTQLVLDARMRPLAGMTAHESALWRERQQATPTARRASASVLCGVVQPDLHEIGLFEGLELDSWKSRPAHVEGLGASWRGVGYRVLQFCHGMPNMWGPDPNRTPRPLALGRDVLDYLQHGE